MTLKLDRFHSKDVEKARSQERVRDEGRQRNQAEEQAALKQSLVGDGNKTARQLPYGTRYPVVEKGTGSRVEGRGSKTDSRSSLVARESKTEPGKEAELRKAARDYHRLVQPRVTQPTVALNPFSKDGTPNPLVTQKPVIQLLHQQPHSPQGRATVQQAAIRPEVHQPRRPAEGERIKANADPQGTEAAKQGEGANTKFVAAMAGVAGARVGTKADGSSSLVHRDRVPLDSSEEEGEQKPEAKRGGAVAGRTSVYRGPLDQLTGGMGSMAGDGSGDDASSPFTLSSSAPFTLSEVEGLRNPNLPVSVYDRFCGVRLVNGAEGENGLYDTAWRYRHYVEQCLNESAQLLRDVDDKELREIFPRSASRRVVLAAASRGGEEGGEEKLREAVLRAYNAQQGPYGGRHV